MAKLLLSAFTVGLSLVVAPLVMEAQTNSEVTYRLTVDAKTYEVGVNGVFARLCERRSAQILSKKTGFPLDRVKKGVLMGEVTLTADGKSFPLTSDGKTAPLTSDGKTFPFDLHLKDVTVTDAHVRGNGTWTMTLGWSSCTRTEKKK